MRLVCVWFVVLAGTIHTSNLTNSPSTHHTRDLKISANHRDQQATGECVGNGCNKSTGDKPMFQYESIKALHDRLDDDHNGNVDRHESDDFLRDELNDKNDHTAKQNIFHGEDSQISVDDLWHQWIHSEVYNWTVGDMCDWLEYRVILPQYITNFQTMNITGAMLPSLALNNANFMQTLKVLDPIHRKKLSVKAMDAVLFGSPKDRNLVKDIVLTSLLIIAVLGCWRAHVQQKRAKLQLKKMSKDLEGLWKAEESLSELQKELESAKKARETVQEEKQTLEARLCEEAKRLNGTGEVENEVERMKKAEEELMLVRLALKKAQTELELHCTWQAPPGLQEWLQLTYELEVQQYMKKRRAAEQQLLSAKDGCEKIRKKRSTLLGNLRVAHGSSLDDVDHRIVAARASLLEVTTDLRERLNRWKQVELLVNFSIVTNPGLDYLKSVLNYNETLYNQPGGPPTINGGTQHPLRHVGSRVLFETDVGDETPPPTYNVATGSKLCPTPGNFIHVPSSVSLNMSSIYAVPNSTQQSTSTSSFPQGFYNTTPGQQQQQQQLIAASLQQRKLCLTPMETDRPLRLSDPGLFTIGDSPICMPTTTIASTSHPAHINTQTIVMPPLSENDVTKTTATQRPGSLRLSNSELSLSSLVSNDSVVNRKKLKKANTSAKMTSSPSDDVISDPATTPETVTTVEKKKKKGWFKIMSSKNK